ncbi:hypothetical protein B296_00039815 [Ensete ventricosum]|uniref:Uncharacterized protein n=1 Tax=Ensete ventricosum TaxID=4639 RepID=A0A426XHZ5_ENSVE|nr:hypothetical protein B296_00039815 [Ensete ventricosum]
MAPSVARVHLRATAPAILNSRSPSSDVPPKRNHHLRRRRLVIKYRPFPAPESPPPRSKLGDADRSSEADGKLAAGGASHRKGGDGVRRAAPVVSARRLAAALWHLRPLGAGEVGRSARLGFTTNVPEKWLFVQGSVLVIGLLNIVFDLYLFELTLYIFILNDQAEVSSSLPCCIMEKAKNWDSNVLKDICHCYGHLKLLEDQQVNGISIMSALQLELERARSYIIELESKRRSAKKKLNRFLKSLEKEQASWRNREHEKVRSMIEAVKCDLSKERKNRKWLEVVNAKLVDELAEAKLLAKRYLLDFEEERKVCELMEELHDELAKEIGEGKAEVEALNRESAKLREEMDEERRMLQMAEVWREERVQMKLVDAKLMLEEKYLQLCDIQADMEAFLKVQGGIDKDMAMMQEAEMLKDVLSSIKVQGIKFCYQPPASGDMSVFEELQPIQETNGQETGQCNGYSPASHASGIHTVSPETDLFLQNTAKYDNGTVNRCSDVEDDSGWETVCQPAFHYPEGSDSSVNCIYEESHGSVRGTYWDEQGDSGKINTRQCRRKVSSISRFWRSSSATKGDSKNIISVELSNGRLSNCRMPNAALFSDVESDEVSQMRSSDLLDPHVTPGTIGCTKWPRGTQKHSLKAKLLEARMESQKIQLRRALKQKDST